MRMATLSQYLRLSDATADEQAERIRKFAAKIEVDVVTVRRYLSGTRRPKWEVMARIVKATQGEVTADAFMPGQKKQKQAA